MVPPWGAEPLGVGTDANELGRLTMIIVSRLNGARFAINDMLVERVEANPDTVVVLSDGKKFIVRESLDDVVRQIAEARAEVHARAERVEVVDVAPPALRLIEGEQHATEGDSWTQ